MHPNSAFHYPDETAVFRFAAERSFAHIFSCGPEGMAVVHTPVLVIAERRVRFHLSRRNQAAGQMAGRRALISIADRDGYQSGNWYASPDQVPTWHYEAVEIEGSVRVLDAAELVPFLDTLSAAMEHRHSPERPWTRANMSPGKFNAMLGGIIGFELEPEAVRGTAKFNQHKPEADRDAAVAGQLRAGRKDVAAALAKAGC